MSKLVGNDAGGYTDRSGHFLQVGPQLFDQGLLAMGTRQQPTVERQWWIERTEEAQALYKLTYKRIYGNHSFGLQLAKRNVNCPAIRADIPEAIPGDVGTFANAHTGMAQQQEDVGRQIVASEQLLLDKLILLCRQGAGYTLRRTRSVLATDQAR